MTTQAIAPCIWLHGRIVDVSRYAPGEGPEGAVKHGRFVLAGQDMVAMDSHLAHGIPFNEALSFQVTCEDQPKDRFGVSWQVIPAGMGRWMSGGDCAARNRTFAAMMTTGKLDIAALERAWAGG